MMRLRSRPTVWDKAPTASDPCGEIRTPAGLLSSHEGTSLQSRSLSDPFPIHATQHLAPWPPSDEVKGR
jgi:hypothetical protein